MTKTLCAMISVQMFGGLNDLGEPFSYSGASYTTPTRCLNNAVFSPVLGNVMIIKKWNMAASGLPDLYKKFHTQGSETHRLLGC